MALIKTLPRIAARILHNTHVGRQNMKEKFELLSAAYGTAAVEEDFEKWCEEQKLAPALPRYPLTDYIRVIDQRLGPAFAQPKVDVTDPRIVVISSLAYEKTGILPSTRSVANLLASFSVEEIRGALLEYASTLDDKEVKTGMHNFFTEGGASAVIYAQRRRKS